MAVASETVIKRVRQDPYRVRVAVRGEAGAATADSCAAGQLADYHEREPG